jgi:hypothetical protein
VLLAALVLAIEVGFRIGRRAGSGVAEGGGWPTGTLLGASLALLGLLLGFTFSMAVSRFDARKQLVIDESNAIGTAYLRSAMLPEPWRGKSAELLRRYVDIRVGSYEEGAEPERLREATRRGEQVQQQLWSLAVGAAEKDPHSLPVGLYVQSLNDLIDLDAKRLNALENTVPESVLYLVALVGVVSAAVVGYECGRANRRYVFSTMALSVLITLVVLVILDIDRPRRGLIRAGQASMLRLRESLGTASP